MAPNQRLTLNGTAIPILCASPPLQAAPAAWPCRSTSWVVLADQEQIGLALRRLKKLLEREGAMWETRRRRSFRKPTHIRRAKEFKKRFKARQATLLAKAAGEQPSATSAPELVRAFWKRTGKP